MKTPASRPTSFGTKSERAKRKSKHPGKSAIFFFWYISNKTRTSGFWASMTEWFDHIFYQNASSFAFDVIKNDERKPKILIKNRVIRKQF